MPTVTRITKSDLIGFARVLVLANTPISLFNGMLREEHPIWRSQRLDRKFRPERRQRKIQASRSCHGVRSSAQVLTNALTYKWHRLAIRAAEILSEADFPVRSSNENPQRRECCGRDERGEHQGSNKNSLAFLAIPFQ
jgi:hypothetical protein